MSCEDTQEISENEENRVFSNYSSVIQVAKEDTQAYNLCLLACVFTFWYLLKTLKQFAEHYKSNMFLIY